MNLIESIEDVQNNLRTLENYLTSDNPEESDFAEDIIKRGTCFIAYFANGETRFAPSRFSGYLDNSITRHKNNETKHGNETNKALREFLKEEKENPDIEEKYISYCQSHGFVANKTGAFGHPRKYWELELTMGDFPENLVLDDNFPEGKLIERTHKRRERNSKAVVLKKAEFLKEHGSIYCQICELNFEHKYGELGRDFIEVHHTIPVSEMAINHKTTLDELVLVCSNCHRMIHRKRPWLKADKLKELLSKNG